MTCAPISLCGFSRTGFICDARRDARGARLQGLGAADLAAVRRHRGIVRHVLRLERRTVKPALAKARQRPATISDLPTSEPVPWNISVRRAVIKFDACLRLHASREMVLHQSHLGDEIGRFDQGCGSHCAR